MIMEKAGEGMEREEKQAVKILADLEREEREFPYPARRIRSQEVTQVSLLLAGLGEQYGLTLIIVTDLDLLKQGIKARFIRPINELARYPEFCRYLQEEVPGGKRLCHESTVKNVRECLEEAARGDSGRQPRECHMGLRNFYLPLAFAANPQQPLGYCASGKFCFPQDVAVIKENIRKLADRLPGIEERHLTKLEELPVKIPFKDANDLEAIKGKLREGITTLAGMLRASYERNRRLGHRQIRDGIGEELVNVYIKLTDLPEIATSPELTKVLESACKDLGCDYLSIFLSNMPNSTALDLYAQYGLPEVKRTEVHFNWKKGKLNEYAHTMGTIGWDFESAAADLPKGIRGEKKGDLASLSYIYPFEFAKHYGVVVLGPFSRDVKVGREREFLNRLCRTIGTRICSFAVLKTLQKKDEGMQLAVMIPAHTVRHGLHNILGEISLITQTIKGEYSDASWMRGIIKEAVRRTRRLINILAMFASMALDQPDAIRALTLELQEDHLVLEPLTPEVLIDETAPLHVARAGQAGISLMVDDASLEKLPGIMGDSQILKLALEILVENAIKYTDKDKRREIRIRGEWPYGTQQIRMLVSNMGLEIKRHEYDKIFELEYRGEAVKDLLEKGQLEEVGYGIGLSQVKKIIQMHHGEIFVECQKKGAGPWDHLITFTIILPTLVGYKLGIKV
jgi:signal transduction histidine kinase/ligand-binding sensor protein